MRPSDKRPANTLVLSVLPMVRMLVKRRVQPGTALYDDLVQACVLCLLERADEYDPARGSPVTWAWQWVRGTVQREMALLGMGHGPGKNFCAVRKAVGKAVSIDRVIRHGWDRDDTTLQEILPNGSSAIDDVVSAREQVRLAAAYVERSHHRSRLGVRQLLMLGEGHRQTDVGRSVRLSRQRVEQFQRSVAAELRRVG